MSDATTCQFCDRPTDNLGAAMCDACWEVKRRINVTRPDVLRRIIASTEHKQTYPMNELVERLREYACGFDHDERYRDMRRAADALERYQWRPVADEPLNIPVGMGDRVREVDHNVRVLTFVKYSPYGKATTHWRYIDGPDGEE